MISPKEDEMPVNYRAMRRLEWHKVVCENNWIATNDEVWGWLGENVKHKWSYRDQAFHTRIYYFENKKDAEWFVLRWL